MPDISCSRLQQVIIITIFCSVICSSQKLSWHFISAVKNDYSWLYFNVRMIHMFLLEVLRYIELSGIINVFLKAIQIILFRKCYKRLKENVCLLIFFPLSQS